MFSKIFDSVTRFCMNVYLTTIVHFCSVVHMEQEGLRDEATSKPFRIESVCIHKCVER